MRVHEFGLTQGIGRWLRDFVLALSLFWFGVFAFGGPQNHAHAIPLPSHVASGVERPIALNVHAWGRAAQTELRVLRESHEDRTRTLILLSLTFAGLATLNLAFLRHLRRVYASPRRGVWRRD
jgi:hypothetical protein